MVIFMLMSLWLPLTRYIEGNIALASKKNYKKLQPKNLGGAEALPPLLNFRL